MNCRNNYRFDKKNNCRSDKKKFKDSIPNNQKFKIPVSISWWGSIVPSFCASIISLDYQDEHCAREKGKTSSPCPIIRQERMYYFFLSLAFCLNHNLYCVMYRNDQKTVILRMNRECSCKNDDITDKGL